MAENLNLVDNLEESMTKEFKKLFEKELEEIKVELTEEQLIQFYRYYEILGEWNKVMNLTAIVEWKEVITKHFVDSLSLVNAVSQLERNGYSIIDVGTGAGFPGIPLKIAFPNLNITLLDSLNKRVKFLNEVSNQLSLKGISAIHGRAEDYGRDRVYREKFDLCVSRAVANMSTLSEYCLPFVKKDGYFIPYKSGKIEEELKQSEGAIKKLGGRIEEVITFSLPNADERSLVKIKKNEVMSKIYPRKSGMPAKEPLS